MKTELEQFEELLHSLNLEEEDQNRLRDVLLNIRKGYQRLDFMLNRTLKDKFIAINLLNTTIQDLKEKKAYIEKTNEQLLIQKKEIEAKNIELEQQKKIVEDQSKILQRNLKELEQSYQELEQFAYIASHDLKSPLRSISSFGQLLQKRHSSQLDRDGNEFVGFMLDNASKMDGIIQDLLKYSRAGVSKKEFVLADLEHLLEVAKINLQPIIQKSSAAIHTTALPTLSVIKRGISQLFEQLLSNAIKFCKPAITPVIHISAQEEEHFWHFEVKDNGMGLDESYHDKVFQPHQRFGEHKTHHTGMGLAICRKIIRFHNGQIWYKSVVGEGATFHFTIAKGLGERNGRPV